MPTPRDFRSSQIHGKFDDDQCKNIKNLLLMSGIREGNPHRFNSDTIGNRVKRVDPPDGTIVVNVYEEHSAGIAAALKKYNIESSIILGPGPEGKTITIDANQPGFDLNLKMALSGCHPAALTTNLREHLGEYTPQQQTTVLKAHLDQLLALGRELKAPGLEKARLETGGGRSIADKE